VREHVRRIEAWVPVDASLQDALAMTLLTDDGWVAVLCGDTFAGVLTPDAVYRSLRASQTGSDPEAS
jgi:osmoprotectant transport system ATP-binding protein